MCIFLTISIQTINVILINFIGVILFLLGHGTDYFLTWLGRSSIKDNNQTVMQISNIFSLPPFLLLFSSSDVQVFQENMFFYLKYVYMATYLKWLFVTNVPFVLTQINKQLEIWIFFLFFTVTTVLKYWYSEKSEYFPLFFHKDLWKSQESIDLKEIKRTILI